VTVVIFGHFNRSFYLLTYLLTTWLFGVTWRHPSCDRCIPHKSFPVGSSL